MENTTNELNVMDGVNMVNKTENPFSEVKFDTIELLGDEEPTITETPNNNEVEEILDAPSKVEDILDQPKEETPVLEEIDEEVDMSSELAPVNEEVETQSVPETPIVEGPKEEQVAEAPVVETTEEQPVVEQPTTQETTEVPEQPTTEVSTEEVSIPENTTPEVPEETKVEETKTDEITLPSSIVEEPSTNAETVETEENNEVAETTQEVSETETQETTPEENKEPEVETKTVEEKVEEKPVEEKVEETPSTDKHEPSMEEVKEMFENKDESGKPVPDDLLHKYGEDFTAKTYVCNPAIGRDEEIKQLILCLLTPEKSGILVGKPGIGKTAIVEGLTWHMQNGNIPDALKPYRIFKLNTTALLGTMPDSNELKIQALLQEIKDDDKLILFLDEIHTLIGTSAGGSKSMDFAQVFKPGLDRGSIKIIGATTTDEYNQYILTDKAFVRRFQKINVEEPSREHTIKILLGSLPKLEHKTGAKLKYTDFVKEQIMAFIVDLTSEYRRVYELASRYPDVALTLLQQAFSYAVFENHKEVTIHDVRTAIVNTKLVYPDVVKKELLRFNEIFKDIYTMETPQRLKGERFKKHE